MPWKRSLNSLAMLMLMSSSIAQPRKVPTVLKQLNIMRWAIMCWMQ